MNFATLAVGLVINSQPTLFLDGVALVVQIILGYGQATHSISFEKEGQIQLVCRKSLEVVGSIFICGAVHCPPVIENKQEMLTRTYVFRPFEHHVLKEVGKASTTGSLVA